MANTGFTINGTDVSNGLVTKDFLIGKYPDLFAQYRTAGIYVLGWDYEGLRGDGVNYGTVNQKYSSPVQAVNGDVGWRTLATHNGPMAYHTAAIKNDGTLWLWGSSNTYGVLGNGTTAGNYSPVQTSKGGTDWKQVSVSHYGTNAIKTDGSLWSWGYATNGADGTGNGSNKSTPVQIGTNKTWRQVSQGGGMSGAIADDGTLWVWGRNGYDGIGDGSAGQVRSTPVQIGTDTNWKQLSMTSQHGAAVKTDGTLWLWGYNYHGQLGINNTASRSTPVQTVAAGTNWKKIAVGQHYSAAIKTDGTLWTWGANSYGQLGVGDTNKRSSPTQVAGGGTNWLTVSLRWIGGWSHPTAIKTDGTLWNWGNNMWGQLGTGDTDVRYTPTQVAVGGNNWKQIATGYRTAVLLRDDAYDFGAGTL